MQEVAAPLLLALSADCRRCVAAATVMGREFRVPVLARALGWMSTQAALLELLDEAQRAGLVETVPGEPDAFRFADASTGKTVYLQLGNAERARLHRAVARAIEGQYAGALESHYHQLAHHLAQAGADGDAPRAIDYALNAAARFDALHQHEEAVRSYQLARAVLLRAATDPRRHCKLLLGLGSAQQRAGRKRESRATLERAAELARHMGAPELLARAALGYGAARHWGETGAPDQTLTALLQESLRHLPVREHGLRALVHARLAEELYHLAPDQRRGTIRAAVAAARRSGDPAVLAQALLSRRLALWTPETLKQRRRDATEALALARRADDREIAAQATGWLISDLLELGNVGDADLHIQAFSTLAQELRQPALLRHELAVRSMRAAMLGRFVDAERLATAALQMGQALEDPDAALIYGIQLFSLRRLQGRLDEIEPIARGFSDSLQNVWMWRVGLASIAAALGRVAEARHALDYLARDDFAGVARDAYWLTAAALLTEVCAFLRDIARASILYDRLAPFAERHIIAVPGFASAGSASYYLGLYASTMGERSVAIRHFETALAMNKKMQAVPQVAQTEYALAAALLARNHRGDAQRAAKLLASAIPTYEALEMRGYLEQARALRDGRSRVSTSAGDASPHEASQLPVFLRDEDAWTVTWQRKTVRLKNVRGLRVIAHLVRHPGRRFHVTELAPVADDVAHVAESAVSKRLSPQQRESLRWRSYWREFHRLEWEAGNAERRGDRAGVQILRRKVQRMRRQLEDKRAAEVEQVRKRIGRSLDTALKDIAQKSEELRRHLGRSIDRRLKEVVYEPDSDIDGERKR